MIQYRIPVRMNTAQLLTYTFRDQDKNIIDLSNYVSASLEIKNQGVPFLTVTAIISSAPQGQVQYVGYVFTTPGEWDAQFYVVDGSGNKVFGEPVQFKVVKNTEDLSLTELPTY